ncbi:hypothetical protein [Loktanella sp. SALINAS62]|nr:hypothetical protein [Loktanella sp. SALINAS62]
MTIAIEFLRRAIKPTQRHQTQQPSRDVVTQEEMLDLFGDLLRR